MEFSNLSTVSKIVLWYNLFVKINCILFFFFLIININLFFCRSLIKRKMTPIFFHTLLWIYFLLRNH